MRYLACPAHLCQIDLSFTEGAHATRCLFQFVYQVAWGVAGLAKEVVTTHVRAFCSVGARTSY
jgi:hypothetical protein